MDVEHSPLFLFAISKKTSSPTQTNDNVKMLKIDGRVLRELVELGLVTARERIFASVQFYSVRNIPRIFAALNCELKLQIL
jgi:hypothetical protein